MQQSRIICLGGPSGAGKDTLATAFLSRYKNYVRVPRSTTRKPRIGEVEGVHYHFLTEFEFHQKVATGNIIAVDTFCCASYGIDLANIRETLSSDKKIIGVFGVCSIILREILKEEKMSLVYVTAPIPFLENRLVKRGDSTESVRVRISAAKDQVEKEPRHFDHILWNTESIENALLQLSKLIGLK